MQCKTYKIQQQRGSRNRTCGSAVVVSAARAFSVFFSQHPVTYCLSPEYQYCTAVLRRRDRSRGAEVHGRQHAGPPVPAQRRGAHQGARAGLRRDAHPVRRRPVRRRAGAAWPAAGLTGCTHCEGSLRCCLMRCQVATCRPASRRGVAAAGWTNPACHLDLRGSRFKLP